MKIFPVLKVERAQKEETSAGDARKLFQYRKYGKWKYLSK